MSRFFEALQRAEKGRTSTAESIAPRNARNGTSSHNVDSRESNGVSLHPTPYPLHPTKAQSPEPRAQRTLVTVDLSEDRIDEHLVSLLSPTVFAAEQYHVLRHVIEEKRRHEDARVVAVSSAAVGDGKTITSINLAGALAQSSDTRVLLVDVDLRRPAVTELLGIRRSHQPGVVDLVLNSQLSLDDIVVSCPAFNLSVIPSGPVTNPPYEILKDSRFIEMMKEARRRFDYVLLDTPPLLPFPDCRLIEKCTDGFLVVVAAHKTPPNMLEEALKVVDNGRMLGLVFNLAETSAKTRYKGYQNYDKDQAHHRNLQLWGRKS